MNRINKVGLVMFIAAISVFDKYHGAEILIPIVIQLAGMSLFLWEDK